MLHPISRFAPWCFVCPGRLGFRRDARKHGERLTVRNVARFPPNAAQHLIHAEALERLHGCGFELAPQRAALAVGSGFWGARARGGEERRESKEDS